MTGGERIRYLRKTTLNLTLEKFGKRLGVGKSAISDIENERNALSDQMAKSISREFNVREEWLRDGEGEMFVRQSRNERIAEFINAIQMEDDGSFKKRFIAALSSMTTEEWGIVAAIAKKMAEENMQEDPGEEDSAPTREELHAELDRQLDLEKKAGEESSVIKNA